MARRPVFDPSRVRPRRDPLLDPVPDGPDGPWTVSELTARIKAAIKSSLPASLDVVGQLSNFKRHSSGHLYFTLKDSAAELACVMWRSSAGRLKFQPQDGMEVVVTGYVDVYERGGRHQLYAQRIDPRGVGALELAFRQLHARLAAEGLFDPDHKLALPAFPRHIVLVTSPTGAAVRDMLQTLRRRFPAIDVSIYPVPVQGDAAAPQIARALRLLGEHGSDLGIDLVIVGRGGGSLEDLWAFNEEEVARAVYACSLPIISAVGHEVDVSICDLVADVRAATPTAAAELAVPVQAEVLSGLDQLGRRIHRSVAGQVVVGRAALTTALRRRWCAEPLEVVHRRGQALDDLEHRAARRLGERCARMRRHLDALLRTVATIAPHAHWSRQAVRLANLRLRLASAMRERMVGERLRLDRAGGDIQHASVLRRPRAERHELDAFERRLATAIAAGHRASERCVDGVESLLTALSHKSVLQRGFAITRLKRGRAIVRGTAGLKDGDRVVTELADGEFESEVVNLRQLELFGPSD